MNPDQQDMAAHRTGDAGVRPDHWRRIYLAVIASAVAVMGLLWLFSQTFTPR